LTRSDVELVDQKLPGFIWNEDKVQLVDHVLSELAGLFRIIFEERRIVNRARIGTDVAFDRQSRLQIEAEIFLQLFEPSSID
jgi:hypothetical protein